ncbi:MAG: hypothetical protein H0X13_16365 [Ramlibacter sp.]|nr:hypothetical protein [Ramlibacter sp.]
MKYTGRLGKPITRRPIGGLLNLDESIRTAIEAEANEMWAKLPDLFAAHAVRENDWCGLALALAKAHVTGFKVADPPGRRTEWSAVDKAELRIDADEVRDATGKTVEASIREATKVDRWKEKVKGMKPAALRQHYYQAETSWVQMVKDARAYRQERGVGAAASLKK